MITAKAHIAVGVAEKGGPLTALRLNTPTPKENEILVQVLYVGFTPLSQWQVDFGLLLSDFPHVLGGAIAGKVIEVGDAIKHVKKGDLVMGYSFKKKEQKAMQEYVVIPENLFCQVPENLFLPLAASVPDSFVTAWHSLTAELVVPMMDIIQPGNADAKRELVTRDMTFLVWGGATSSGMYTIQLLRCYKHIFTTASQKHVELLTSCGASRVFNYRDEDAVEQSRKAVLNGTGKIDVVLDCVGDEEKTVKPISELVDAGSCVGILLPIRSGGYGSTTEVYMEAKVGFPPDVKVLGVRTHHYQRVVEGSTFLERTANAIKLMREGRVSGEKLIVRVPEDFTC